MASGFARSARIIVCGVLTLRISNRARNRPAPNVTAVAKTGGR